MGGKPWQQKLQQHKPPQRKPRRHKPHRRNKPPLHKQRKLTRIEYCGGLKVKETQSMSIQYAISGEDVMRMILTVPIATTLISKSSKLDQDARSRPACSYIAI